MLAIMRWEVSSVSVLAMVGIDVYKRGKGSILSQYMFLLDVVYDVLSTVSKDCHHPRIQGKVLKATLHI